MEYGMDRLAFVQTTDEQGQDISFPACDVRMLRENAGGCAITFADGTTLVSSASVTTIRTAIDTLWDEWITAIT